MRYVSNLFLSAVLAVSVMGALAQAADQKVTLMLGGKHCDSYLSDVETALMKVPGVKKADVKSMPGHAVVEMDTAKSKPDQAVKAVNDVKGSGWNCTAELMK
jgi:periplasmic mercuric ion binding protein